MSGANQLAAILWVGLGGALGSIARYLVGNWFLQRVGPSFPWGTFAINVTGSFAIGFVLQLAQSRSGLHPAARLFLTTGILGGYTTFSAFAYETYALSRSGFNLQSASYALGSVLAAVVAAYAGVVAARVLESV